MHRGFVRPVTPVVQTTHCAFDNNNGPAPAASASVPAAALRAVVLLADERVHAVVAVVVPRRARPRRAARLARRAPDAELLRWRGARNQPWSAQKAGRRRTVTSSSFSTPFTTVFCTLLGLRSNGRAVRPCTDEHAQVQLHSLSGPPVRVVQLGAVAPDLGALRALVVGPDPAGLLARLNPAVRLDLRHAELTDVLVGLRQQTTGQSSVVNVKRKEWQASTASSWIAAKDSYSDSQ